MSEQDPKVSVIIPVYRSEDHIAECLKSLQEQYLSDIEIICVDDRGGDKSMQIVADHQVLDSRIRILKNAKNSGAGISRNKGIEEARGEYLSFVDPDDTLAPDFLQLLYYKAISSQADIAKGSRSLVTIHEGKRIETPQTINERIRRRLAQGEPLYLSFTYQHTTALYKRAFIMETGARYGTSRNAQDTTFLLRVCYMTNNIVFADKAFYYYEQREGSAVHTFSAKRLENELCALREKIDFVVEQPTLDTYMYQFVIFRFKNALNVHVLACMNRIANDDELEVFLQGIREQVKRLPDQDHIKEESLELKALLEYGINLSWGLGVAGSQSDQTSLLQDTMSRWIDFIETNRKLDRCYIDAMASFVKDVLKKAAREAFEQGQSELESAHNNDHIAWMRNKLLKSKKLVTLLEENSILAVFLKSGLNVYPAPRTKQLDYRSVRELLICQHWIDFLADKKVRNDTYLSCFVRAIHRALRVQAEMKLDPEWADAACEYKDDLKALFQQISYHDDLIARSRFFEVFWCFDTNVIGGSKFHDPDEDLALNTQALSHWLALLQEKPQECQRYIPIIRKNSQNLLLNYSNYVEGLPKSSE